MGAGFTELVTVQHERAAAPRQERISSRVRKAVDLMVFDGIRRDKAAEMAGISDHTLYMALRKPAVLAFMNTQQQALRTSAAARSIARVDKLADDSSSDHVKLESNKFLLGIEGVTVINKSESTNVHKHLFPGLTLNIINGALPGDDAHLIDGQVREVGSANPVNGLPKPVPHPSMRNAAQIAPETDGQGPKKEGRRQAPRGEKP